MRRCDREFWLLAEGLLARTVPDKAQQPESEVFHRPDDLILDFYETVHGRNQHNVWSWYTVSDRGLPDRQMR